MLHEFDDELTALDSEMADASFFDNDLFIAEPAQVNLGVQDIAVPMVSTVPPTFQALATISNLGLFVSGLLELCERQENDVQGVAIFASFLYVLSFWPKLNSRNAIKQTIFSTAATQLLTHYQISKDVQLLSHIGTVPEAASVSATTGQSRFPSFLRF